MKSSSSRRRTACAPASSRRAPPRDGSNGAGTCRAIHGILDIVMRFRRYKIIPLLMALFLAVSSGLVMPGRAEAQMRCAATAPMSPPCARVEIPAAGMSKTRINDALMACCRSMRGGCAMMRDCPGTRRASKVAAPHRSVLSARRCLVSIRVTPTCPPTPTACVPRWLLTATPALVPPGTAPALCSPPTAVSLIFWPYSHGLTRHSAPKQHGLRAPPTA